MMDDASGELVERRLENENGEASAFYRSLPKPVRLVRIFARDRGWDGQLPAVTSL